MKNKVDANVQFEQLEFKQLAEGLRKADERCALKMADDFIVYAYRCDGKFTPNMLLLPKSTKDANPFYIKECVNRAEVKYPPSLMLYEIGVFNIKTAKYTPRRPVVVVPSFEENKKAGK